MSIAEGLKTMVCNCLPLSLFKGMISSPVVLIEYAYCINRNKTWNTLAPIRSLVLLFTDRCPWPLEAQDEVEKIQNKLIKALEKLVAETYQRSGGGRFAKLMDVFVRLRGMYKAYEDAVKVMSKDEFLIECIPEILFWL